MLHLYLTVFGAVVAAAIAVSIRRNREPLKRLWPKW